MARISPITLADRESWQPLWDAYLAFYETELPHDVSDNVFDRLVEGSELHGVIAWGDDGEALGIVHWLFHASTWATTPNCYLADLFVSPAARGLGVGKALIEHVNAAARTARADRVYWHTHENNTTAQSLYGKVATRTGHIEFEQPLG
jgi:GNAT superfamily N-acetyltransferase